MYYKGVKSICVTLTQCHSDLFYHLFVKYSIEGTNTSYFDKVGYSLLYTSLKMKFWYN